MRSEVVAILCADLHLSLNPPVWRSAEPDWFAAMARPLKEISKLQEEHDCVILCAGDIFHKWNSPPELINFAIDNLPDKLWAIPGQHDLPLHNYADIKKSAFWTLSQSQIIHHMHPHEDHLFKSNTTVFGFPFGYGLKELPLDEGELGVAVIHEYKWIKGHNYTGAPKENEIGKRIAGVDVNDKWLGYDVVVYGDNHKGFLHQIEGTQIFNCGSMMRRNSDQIDYKPMVGLLFGDGTVVPYYLDTTLDKHLDVSDSALGNDSLDMKEFIKELEKLGDSDLDFSDSMNHYLKENKINMPICKIILEAMEQ